MPSQTFQIFLRKNITRYQQEEGLDHGSVGFRRLACLEEKKGLISTGNDALHLVGIE